MEDLAGSPLEIKDFSGGITDNFFSGDKRRYLKADNWIIQVDKQLRTRDGTIIYDSVGYSLEGLTPGERIGGLYTAINETYLFGLAARNFFIQPTPGTAFAKVPGVAGNESLSSGGPYNQVTLAEFQKQIFYTSDAPARPGKMYKDSTNTWVTKTAGLPQMKGTSNYTDSDLLTKCIALANALRASFVAHLKDYSTLAVWQTQWSGATVQHKWLDKWSLSYFEPVTFLSPAYTNADPEYPGPSPVPTPAPAATDAASLYTLCVALSAAYEHHRIDLAGQSPSNGTIGNYKYHQYAYIFPGISGGGTIPSGLGIATSLTAKQNPSTLTDAAAFLDDFFQKHYWHMMAPTAHSSVNDVPTMARYLVSSSYKVGTITAGEPLITPNYGPFIDMAMYLQKAFDDHTQSNVSPGLQHYQRDISSHVTLNYPNDFDSACLSLFWCRWMYGFIHYADANNLIKGTIKFSSTSGSPNITSVVDAVSGATVTLTVGQWIGGYLAAYAGPIFSASDPRDVYAARVTASGAGTATLDRNCVATAALNLGQNSSSWTHGSWSAGAQIQTTISNTLPTATSLTGGTYAYGSIGTSLKTWISLGSDFTQAFGYHSYDAVNHRAAYFMGTYFVNSQTTLPLINGNAFYIPSAASYDYFFFYANSYQVETDGLTYLTRGNPVLSGPVFTCASYPVNAIIPSLDTKNLYADSTIAYTKPCAVITRMQPLSNDSTTNYDLSNTTEEVYRTTDGGTVGYLLTSLPNGTTIYSDATSDTLSTASSSALNTNKPLYTNGGVLGSDQPPQSKFIHFLNGFMYFGGVNDTNGAFLPNRLMQSTQYAPDSVPAANYIDLDDELTGISSARNVPIALCKNSIYRIEGNFDSTGKGFLNAQKLSDAMGCFNAKSIVKTEIGVFYAGSDGFYYTDGYQMIKISLDLDRTYRSLTLTDNQRLRICGAYDKTRRLIFWAMQSNPNGTDNDIFYIYYLDYGVKPYGVYTTMFSQYLQSWAPASCVFYKGNLVIGDAQGYLFKSDPYTKTDPKISFGTDPSTWNTLYIPWDFKSCALDFGTIFKRKWITKIHVAGDNIGDTAIQPQSIKDNNATGNGIQDLIPIQYHGNFVWGDPNFIWGDSDFKWKYDGDSDAIRRFPAGSMRSDFRQFRFFPADITVYKSDDYPFGSFATVSSVSKTAFIATPPGYTNIVWPNDVYGMRICFDTDNYENEYDILSLDVTKQLIVFSDADNTSVTLSGCKWEIRGVKKEQKVQISSVVIHYGYLGDQVTDVNGASSPDGENNNS